MLVEIRVAYQSYKTISLTEEERQSDDRSYLHNSMQPKKSLSPAEYRIHKPSGCADRANELLMVVALDRWMAF